MKKLLLLLMLFTLAGCSTQEYFAIFNSSNSVIEIYYTLDRERAGIFEDRPACYKISSGDIDWDSYMNIRILQPEVHKVIAYLPPGCVLMIGTLSNDSYKKYNQKFTSDQFNLKEMRIVARGKSQTILPSTFDKHFKKSNGVIELRMK